MARQIDWDSIEVHYRAGAKSIRDVAAEHGVPESTIRTRAKKYGWSRNPAALKRERVNAALAAGAQNAARFGAHVDEAWAREVDADVADMDRGLRVYRKILERLETEVETVRGFRAIKTIAEAVTVAIAGIRRIRGLDAPIDLGKMSDEDLQALAQGKSPR
ncbi:hypothetical protein [Methylocaldum sp.]|uniref:hypothetical protein n=1 Tax=Methylocaldum sp. TaxID=1969727 RepID=UPI002D4185E6|nr:hypothetical protein [Methylocaldum sp.]HYE36133.1 hypothetical protein [Methylocaldum sp.]